MKFILSVIAARGALVLAALLAAPFSLAQAAPSEAVPAATGEPLSPARGPVAGEPPPKAAEARPRSTARRALAPIAAVIPGALVHGTGHLVAGDPSAALRLLAMEGIGLVMAGSGYLILNETGASRRLAGPLSALTVGGAGLFVFSALADLYGVLVPEGERGSPPDVLPFVETRLGARYVYDPMFSYRFFIAPSLDLRWGPLRLNPSAWFAADDVNSRFRALASYRFSGPMAAARPAPGDQSASDGSALDLEAALTHHRYSAVASATLGGAPGVAVTTLEMTLNGRLDTSRIAASLRGSFVEFGGGGALEIHDYGSPETEGSSMLLLRVAYGVYIGRPPSPWGEASFYYDHRTDGYAGGIKLRGIADRLPGHVGLAGSFYFSPRWGFDVDVQAGSAWIAGGSLIYRYGASP